MFATDDHVEPGDKQEDVTGADPMGERHRIRQDDFPESAPQFLQRQTLFLHELISVSFDRLVVRIADYIGQVTSRHRNHMGLHPLVDPR